NSSVVCGGAWRPRLSGKEEVASVHGGYLLLDRLIRQRQESRRHLDAKRAGSLQVDDELEFVGAMHWKVGWLLPIEDASSIDAGLGRSLRAAETVAHEPAGLDNRSKRINRRHGMLRRLGYKLHASIGKQGIRTDQKGVHALRQKVSK